MRTAPWSALLFALSVLCLSPEAARADVPPPDSCPTVGQACSNAVDGGASGLSGTCQAAQCTRTTPAGPITYACSRCVPSPTQETSSCSCAVPGASRDGAPGALVVAALALATTLTSRRARR